MYNYIKKTRAWTGDSGDVLQFRTDLSPFIYLHNGCGCTEVGNCPINPELAEKQAEELAEKMGLKETSQEYAHQIAGWR